MKSLLVALSLSLALGSAPLVTPLPSVLQAGAQPSVPPSVRRLEAQTAVPRAARASTAAIAIDRASLERFASTGGGLLHDFPLGPDQSATLELAPVDPFTSDAVLQFGSGRPQPLRARGAFLAGSVAGDPGSQAFLAVSDAGEFGFVRTRSHTYIISSGPKARGLPTVSYDIGELPAGFIDPPAWTCATPEPPQGAVGAPADGGIAGAQPCRQVRLAFDTDYEFLGLFGGSPDAATAYVATLSAALDTIFERDLSVQLGVRYLRFWAEPDDPWDKVTLSEQLSQFRSFWLAQASDEGDLVQLLSGRSLGGGVSWISGLCSSSRYSVSANIEGYFPSPLVNNSAQNWDPLVTAHELGHSFGMWHTHTLTPPVDGCGDSPPDCAVATAGAGTLMSYCHLCAGGLANMRMEFHPASIAQAEAHLAQVPCNYLGTAVPPAAIDDLVAGMTGVATRIDVLANEIDVNCEVISISAYAATTELGGTVTRSFASGAGARDELLYTPPAGATSGIDRFTYTVRDTGGMTTTARVTVELMAPRAPDNPIGATPQLDARYYSIGSLTVLPDYDLMAPYGFGTVAQVNYAPTTNTFATSGRSDYVGARFRGWISVPTTGLWRFYLASDEGSRMSLGTTVVVNNDGRHGYIERSGDIALTAGVHALTIDYFERTGSAGLVFSWQAPGGAKQVVPAANLLRGGTNSPADLNNDGAVNAADMTILLSDWGRVGSPYDLTGDGIVTGADLSVVLFNWTG